MDVLEEIWNLSYNKNVKEDKTIEDNNEILINYVMIRKIWNRTNIVVDNIFAYNIVVDIIFVNENLVLEECRQRKNWYLWKETIKPELNSLSKRQVFGLVVQTPEDVKPVRYKWVFARKRNEDNEIIKYIKQD